MTNTTQSLTYTVEPGQSLHGTLRVPGDKSISHRSIILGSLAEGETEVTGFLEGEDSLHTLAAFQSMGVDIEHAGAGNVLVRGKGLDSLKAPAASIYLGNSGTAMRLMAGVLAGQEFSSEMNGDSSLNSRPMGRIINPLQMMGATISSSDGQRPPMKISGGGLKGIHYETPVASAQIKSCLLLAGLFASGETTIVEPGITRDHTERMLRGFGYDVQVNGLTSSLTGGGSLKASPIDVPSDISSAAFFIVGACIAQGSDLTLLHVGVNPSRTGIIDILRLMGANIELLNERTVGGEPVADIRVRASALKGIKVPADLVPRAIDEFPVLFTAATYASGETVVTDAEELRVKESDRIQAMVDGLSALGANIVGTQDGAIIQGGGLRGGDVDSYGDHRVAMSFAMAAAGAENPIVIRDCANVATSFPNFVELSNEAGLPIKTSDS